MTLARAAIFRPWLKWLVRFFALVGFYDTFVAQFLPDTVDPPTMFEIGEDFWSTCLQAASWLAAVIPWWAWVIGLLATITLSVIEYAVRLQRRVYTLKYSLNRDAAAAEGHGSVFSHSELVNLAKKSGVPEDRLDDTFVPAFEGGPLVSLRELASQAAGGAPVPPSTESDTDYWIGRICAAAGLRYPSLDRDRQKAIAELARELVEPPF